MVFPETVRRRVPRRGYADLPHPALSARVRRKSGLLSQRRVLCRGRNLAQYMRIAFLHSPCRPDRGFRKNAYERGGRRGGADGVARCCCACRRGAYRGTCRGSFSIGRAEKVLIDTRGKWLYHLLLIRARTDASRGGARLYILYVTTVIPTSGTADGTAGRRKRRRGSRPRYA